MNRPTVGDIFSCSTGSVIILCGTNRYYHFIDLNGRAFDTEYIPSDFTCVGHYDLQPMFDFMTLSNANSLNIPTQVKLALKYINTNVYRNGHTYLIGNDLRIEPNENIVYIQLYTDIGSNYQWTPMRDILCKYTTGVNKNGVQ